MHSVNFLFVWFYKFMNLFIFGCIGSSLPHAGFSLVAASGGYSSLWCAGFSLQWLLLLWSIGSRCMGFSSCGTRAQQLWCMGLVAPRHVGSSRARDQTCVPCISRQILNHCATRKSLNFDFSCFLCSDDLNTSALRSYSKITFSSF